jgi:hypothetical protein
MYSDSLIQINADSLVINDYYFPGIGKTIPLEEIVSVHVFPPSVFNGQLRVWGMGFGPAWFAIDWKRPYREAIFVVQIEDTWPAAGFTAESAEGVVLALKDRKVPVEYR